MSLYIIAGMPPKKAEREADELYGAPLGEFTQRRDELARRLRKEGKREDADRVKALRKPTMAAWALNQLARRRPADVERLLAAGKDLRKAHESLLKGGKREALHEATAKERELVDELTRDATAVAGEAGTAVSTSLDEHIRNTLHAAALDGDAGAELKAGRLLRERAPLGVFGTGTAAPPAPPPPTRKRERELQRAVTAAKAAEKTARRAHTQAVKARERAEKTARDAETRAERARAALQDAERAENDTAQALERAARDTEAAESELE